MARAEELQRKLEEAGESNRIITQAVRLKQDEVDQLSVVNSAINRQLKVRVCGVASILELSVRMFILLVQIVLTYAYWWKQ